MFARAHSASVLGIEAHPVIVEPHRVRGLPGISLVGLARGAVKEALVRVRSAIVASGYKVGQQRVVANLIPAELPKGESSLDLALAMSLLASGDVLSAKHLAGRRFAGELSLGGTLEPIRGAVLMADLARREGNRQLIVPRDNAKEAALIPGVEIIGVDTLGEAVLHVCGKEVIAPTIPDDVEAYSASAGCLSEIRGQHRAKRALEISAAGGHNLLFIGPPGSGKTMLARRLPSILPPLTSEEQIEVTRIHSAAGVSDSVRLMSERPFRAPHHTASQAALCGGGSVPRPGEVTLAHRGVLFLDELPEFNRTALESLREPLEDGEIHIARAAMALCFPAEVLLVAAMNPCPCGRYEGDRPKKHRNTNTCMCAFDRVQRYRQRLSGPLLDRIDMHLYVPAVPFREFRGATDGETSAVIRERVLQARGKQYERMEEGCSNADMSDADLRKHVPLNERALDLIEGASRQAGLSARAITRVLKVARTIADLAQSEHVELEHLEEALGYRVLDRDPLALGGTDSARL